MSSWVNDTAVPNHHGNGFPQISDPSAVAGAMMDPSAFMGSPAQFNPQFATTQPMIMPNGPMRNASPGFANPMYQTNPVVPTKRPRPREDSIGQSPRQAPGMLPTSRSETPQSQFSAFSQPGVQQAGQAQYPHLQPNGSANATPSPIMANQMRPGSVPQRVSTTSPHPFSPAAQQFPQQSPIPSEHSVTPQPYMHQQANPYQQGFNPQFNPAQSPARPSPTPNPMAGQMMPQQMMPQRMQQMPGQIPGQMPGQMPSQMAATGQMPNMFNPQQMAQGQNQLDQQQQRMMYQMQIQQQAQAQRTHMMQQQQQMQNQGNPNQAQAQAQAHAQAQVQAQQQAQAQAQARNMMAARQGMPNGQMSPGQMPGQMQGQMGQMSPGQMPQGQMPQGQMPPGQMPPGQMRPQHPMPQQGPMARMLQPEGFMKNLVAFMNSKNLPLETNPVVEGRPVNLFHLFQRVSKFRGYRNVTQSNLWPQVAASLQWAPQQFPQAPPQLKAVYERNLIKYEEMLKMRQQHQEQQAGMSNPPTMPPGTPTKPMQPGQAQQPAHMMGPGAQQQLQQAPMPSPIKPPGQHPGVMNGFPAPHPAHGQPPPGAQGHARNSLSRSVQAPSEQDFSMPSPAQSKTGSLSLPGSAHPESQAAQGETAATMRFPAPFASNPEEYMPCSREVSTYGGVDLKAIEKVAEDLRHSRVDLPAPIELGIVDLHALTKSIQSGIHGEVRLALDNLAALSATDHYGPFPIPQIDLRYCDELVETLVECAEEQADLLAENSEEASNEVTLPLYEEVTRACRIERLTLRKISVLGTQSYELDRAVDRLICITTILRNLSDASVEQNQKILAEESVIKFLCVVIRYLGTREMLCQTNANTLDLMKDIVILLSNIASEVEIPGREQAFCLLQFLLSFAPSPTPASPSDTLFFAPYDPALHPYLPHAVDALAKLLARDQPNRSFYEAIFAADSASTSAPCELLTRTFALAISPIPLPTVDHPRDPRLADAFDSRPPNFPSLVEVRKPVLMQGLLAADILALIAPRDSGVARAWLASGDGFSRNLFLLARQLGAQFENTVLRHGGGPQPRNQPRRDADLSYIVRLAVRLLRRLSESARDSDPTCPIPAQALPDKELVLGALQMQAPEWSKEGMLGDLVAFVKLGI